MDPIPSRTQKQTNNCTKPQQVSTVQRSGPHLPIWHPTWTMWLLVWKLRSMLQRTHSVLHELRLPTGASNVASLHLWETTIKFKLVQDTYKSFIKAISISHLCPSFEALIFETRYTSMCIHIICKFLI